MGPTGHRSWLAFLEHALRPEGFVGAILHMRKLGFKELIHWSFIQGHMAPALRVPRLELPPPSPHSLNSEFGAHLILQ